ncbi:phage terminase small subunit P27 family [Dyadobacter sp. CY327]|uniref:phage terminase small subunit P27 family n=1 Tax=Dyadobacter sp. CY327 TaxID=2907301 RepID=UPI001F24F3F5|nr:phage terminase small subunit P27 family [Dyadobacter sp. CY327]MCE7072000.1 phage terminase small subunit P27 family [Dyadobacter sp. CY327]
MGAGRPPKPTAQKVLEGTARADRMLSNEMMPAKIEHIPSPPRYLTDNAKKEWKLVCADLIELDMLAGVDLSLLSAYCQEMADYVMACEKLKDPEIGYVMTIAREGGSSYSQQTPWVSIKNTALGNALKLANQFGFTPAARSRIQMKPKEEDDELTKLMNRNKQLK